MKPNERIKYLLRLYTDNEATDVEIKEMLFLLRQDADDREFESFIRELRQEEKGMS